MTTVDDITEHRQCETKNRLQCQCKMCLVMYILNTLSIQYPPVVLTMLCYPGTKSYRKRDVFGCLFFPRCLLRFE